MTRFASAPHHLVDEFKRHVLETGQPETFPGLTNGRPPVEGEVVALYTGIDVAQAKRPERDMAPCWICNSGKSKWLRDGTLIWCASTEEIYAIGPECYRTHFGNRLDIALNALRRTQQQALNSLRLQQAAAAADAMLTWITRHLPVAEIADAWHADLAKQAPTFRRSVSRQLKSSGVQLRGAACVKGTWKLAEKLRQAEKVWRQLQSQSANKDLVEWAASLAPRQVEERLVDVRRASVAMEAVAARLSDAADFASTANLQLLAAWGRDAMTPFTVQNTASQVEIRCDGEFWRGRTSFQRPGPLPPI